MFKMTATKYHQKIVKPVEKKYQNKNKRKKIKEKKNSVDDLRLEHSTLMLI